MSDGSNGRLNERFGFGVEVSLESEHNFYTGFTENVSTGGLFIATRDLLAIGTQLQITFSIPDLDSFVATVEVRWHRLEQAGTDGLSPGMGVRFLNLTEDQKRAVNAFIDKRETLFFLDE